VAGPDIPAMGFSSNIEHFYMPDVEKIHKAMKELAEF
jgi:pyruvate/2-oxoglutarate/acetoin dehydrogenase E1 component